MTQDPVVIASIARTPMGAFQGELSSLTAAELGAVVIKAALSRSGLKPEQIDEVIMGCVLPRVRVRRRRARLRWAQACRWASVAPQSIKCAARE